MYHVPNPDKVQEGHTKCFLHGFCRKSSIHIHDKDCNMVPRSKGLPLPSRKPAHIPPLLCSSTPLLTLYVSLCLPCLPLSSSPPLLLLPILLLSDTAHFRTVPQAVVEDYASKKQSFALAKKELSTAKAHSNLDQANAVYEEALTEFVASHEVQRASMPLGAPVPFLLLFFGLTSSLRTTHVHAHLHAYTHTYTHTHTHTLSLSLSLSLSLPKLPLAHSRKSLQRRRR